MPIYVTASPSTAAIGSGLEVRKGRLEFIEFQFRGIAHILGIRCDEEDNGGEICDFQESNPNPTPGQDLQRLYRETMFEYALNHEPIPANGKLELSLAFKDVLPLVQVTLRHRYAEHTGQEPLEEAA